jgi:APA family basic amino acid/polyamine antiporter
MPEPALARRLTRLDATLIVMGGIVGAGIFMNPAVVARTVAAPAAMLGAWTVGGALALAGAFIYAELAARRPHVGGQYAYLREAYHPLVAFLYGWTLLLVSQSGGMAAVAMTFARYFREVTGAGLGEGPLAAVALLALTAVNCLGVRAGSNVQGTFMVLKVAAILLLVACGVFAADGAWSRVVGPPVAMPAAPPVGTTAGWTAFGAALVPVLFAYGGWQTASFMAGEMRDPRRDLAAGLLAGVTGVVVLYLAVNLACLRVLGAAGLAATTAPATSVMRAALGESGATLMALGIAISTLGFLSQGLLTAPRAYFAMAADGLFFRRVAHIHPVTRVPVVAIALQGLLATTIAMSGRYEQILSYVVAIDWVFFGLTAASLFVFRRRDAGAVPGGVRVPGHPVTTVLFVAGSGLVVANTLYRFPREAAAGLGLLLLGIPAYAVWRWRGATSDPGTNA